MFKLLTHPATFLSLVLLTIISGISVYGVGMQHDHQTQKHAQIEGNIIATTARIAILKAEWAYLSRPDRVQQLAERLLELKPLSANQIITDADLEQRNQSGGSALANFTLDGGGQ